MHEGLILLSLFIMTYKLSPLFILFLFPFISFSQWYGFKQAHPISWQSPPFDYNSSGFFSNVFVSDQLGEVYDGYLLFGSGNLCHPDSCDNQTRTFAVKCNTYGDLTWSKRYDEESIDIAQAWGSYFYPSMIRDHYSRIVGVFQTFDSQNGNLDELSYDYLYKLDENAEIIETHLVDSPAVGPGFVIHEYMNSVFESIDSTYMFCGWYTDSILSLNSPHYSRGFVSKIDSLGHKLWEFKSTDIAYFTQISRSIEGGFWCIGLKYMNESCDPALDNYDIVILKLNAEGEEEARMIFGGRCENETAIVHEYEPGRLRVFGRITYPDGDPLGDVAYGYFFSRSAYYDSSNGTIEFDGDEIQCSPRHQTGWLNQLHVLQDGSYIGVGWDYRTLSMPDENGVYSLQMQAIIHKTDPQGVPLWLRYYSVYFDPNGDPEGHGLHYQTDSELTPDNGVVAVGYIRQYYNDPTFNLYTPWILKVDSLGCVEPGCQFVNVEEMVVGLQSTMSIFPNPVSSMATVVFDLENKNAVENYFDQSELLVIDMQGREVSRTAIPFIRDTDRAMIDFSSLAPGYYTIHWISNNTLLDSVEVVKQ